MDFQGKQIGVIGSGVEGVASAAYLTKHGAHVTLLDHKEQEQFDREILATLQKHGVAFVFGQKYLDQLERFDLLVRSPGIKPSLPELEAARAQGVTVTSQTQLFFELCPCPIIGVTGTKGKGTTSTLIYEMLKQAGKEAYLGGNIGKPPFEFLDTLHEHSLVVLELSSFQLQDLTKSPHIGVMLMITSEHLDYHASTEEYVNAKRNLIRFQTKDDFAILNRDYPATNESDIHTDAQIFHVSRERNTERGCYVDVKDKKIYVSAHGAKQEIIATKDILLPGVHNWENVCAAIMAATLAGVKKAAIVEVLKTFKGLEHRLELTREVNGVQFYDDSFSTTPETAIAAIEAFDRPEILILGGSSKGSDFSRLGEVINHASNIKAIIGIGEEWPQIKQFLTSENAGTLLIEGAKNMHQIVQAAAKVAISGDVVLLTPACASFDMFQNYKDRGDQFKKEVQML